MKASFRLILLVAGGVFFSAPRGVAQKGIQFEQGSWNEILAKAKKENKPVFVDVYTSWCGPCKLMARDVFPREDVGEQFNRDFINYKIDAEKGEGIAIAKQYKVNAYPTYLFVNGDGILVYRSLGSMPTERFLNEATIAVNEFRDPRPLAVWEDEYELRKTDTAFLREYMAKRKKLGLNNADESDQYITLFTKEELLNKRILQQLLGNLQSINTDGPLLKFILENTEPVKQSLTEFSRSRFDQHLITLIMSDVDRAIRNRDEILLEKIATSIKKFISPDFPIQWRAYEAKMKYYTQTGDAKKLAKVMEFYGKAVISYDKRTIRRADSLALDQFEKDLAAGKVKVKPENLELTRKNKGSSLATSFSYRVRDMAKSFYQISDDRKQLEKALKWIDLALTFSDNFSVHEIRAGLLYKLGRVAEGISWQEKTIGNYNVMSTSLNTSSEKIETRLHETLQNMKAGKPTWGNEPNSLSTRISSDDLKKAKQPSNQ